MLGGNVRVSDDAEEAEQQGTRTTRTTGDRPRTTGDTTTGQTTISRLGIPTATLVALHMLSVSSPPTTTTQDISLADRTDREVP
jgi:hypothetical protein